MDPLVFEPYLRPMVWGGRRLGELFGKPLPDTRTYGESWEISAHPQHVSRVAEGPFAGRTLTELCHRHAGELLGEQRGSYGQFPLLIKLLDCRELLSIQVHPTDALARRLTREQFGKTEAWIVLDVQPEGRIFAGLRPGITRSDLERHLAAGTLDQCLHSFTPRPGDCIFLPAGTVHAVGGGVVMAEVQQSSDATFRLFDWNRLGTDGKPRALHIRESLQSIDWNAGPINPVRGKAIRNLPPGVRGEALVDCPYFVLDLFQLADVLTLPSSERLSIWMVFEGEAELRCSSGYHRRLQRGESVLVPASSAALQWTPTGVAASTSLISIHLPDRVSPRG